MEELKLSVGDANKLIAEVFPTIIGGFDNITIGKDNIGGFIMKYDLTNNGETFPAAEYLDKQQYLNLLRNCIAINNRYLIKEMEMDYKEIVVKYDVPSKSNRSKGK